MRDLFASRYRGLFNTVIRAHNDSAVWPAAASSTRSLVSRSDDRRAPARHVGDQHATGAVGDAKIDPGVADRDLGSDAAGPEHRHLSVANLSRIAEVGRGEIGNPDRQRVAEVHRGP